MQAAKHERLIMRLIDADALLKAMRKEDVLKVYECIKLVKNAPTVQREGWVSVPIEEMVNRFLGWKLPSDFAPDCGIEFDANKYPNHKFEPIGTNLFTATQAKAMIEYMIQAAPTDKE